MDDGSISVAWKMKISRYSVNIKETLHSASLLSIDVFDYFGEFLVVRHSIVFVLLKFWNGYFFKIFLDIHQVHFKNIFDI
jgi:hypothetical protein